MKKNRKKKRTIYEQYRDILGRPHLSKKEIDRMRASVSTVAQIITGFILNNRLKVETKNKI